MKPTDGYKEFPSQNFIEVKFNDKINTDCQERQLDEIKLKVS